MLSGRKAKSTLSQLAKSHDTVEIATHGENDFSLLHIGSSPPCQKTMTADFETLWDRVDVNSPNRW